MEAFWAFLKNKKGIYFFPERRSGPGASRLCAGCSGGTAWLRVSASVLSCQSRQQASGAARRGTGQDGREINPQTCNQTLCGKISV